MTRYDLKGLWWEDHPATKESGPRNTARHVEPPRTGWTPVKEFPNLTGARVLGFDVETKDLEMTTRGPGAVRGAAHIVGVSIATEDRSWYFPMRHEYEAEKSLNMDPVKVLDFVQEQFAHPVPIVGANLMYDLECTRAEGVRMPAGELFDVQFAEPLIDEEARSYSLETLAQKYLGQGKVSEALYEWCAQSFGGEAGPKQRANIWRSPPSLVGPYAEGDAQQPLRILAKQRAVLHEQQLTDLFRLECALIPILLGMRFRGVRIDVERARTTGAWLREQAKVAQDKIPSIDVWSNDSVARAFEREGLEYPLTDAGNPSFTKEFLESMHHPLAQAVLDVRLYEKAANPFVESYLLGNVVHDRVHCQFHPLRSDNYGTVSGRFSSSNPNLQNIPSRHKIIAPLLRALFIPEEGCKWRRHDYSQIEYRLFAHYAVGQGADEIRRRYNLDPRTDFHELTIALIREMTGVELDRKPAKNINFGLLYGMGVPKLTRSLGLSEDLGARLFAAYFTAVPCVKTTYKSAERIARRRGHIRTVLKRRRRFPGGELTHKALNSILQGGAADLMKKAMVEIWRAGLCDVLGFPHLTVHDELDWSDPCTPESDEAFLEAEHILTHCVPLKVPVLVETTVGDNWGECK